MHVTPFLTTTFLLTLAHAQRKPAAIVTIEASHGGAGQDLTNTTVTIPLTSTYTNASVLDAVSTLYLVGTRGDTPLSSITCTPFRNEDGTGKSGLTFDSTTPSYLSTNTVPLGSIVCITTDISLAPPGGPGGGMSVAPSSSASSSASTSRSTSHSRTRTRSQHTMSMSTSPSGSSSTRTAGAGGQTQAPTMSSSSASTSASPTGAADRVALSGELFGGLALAGFGLAFAL